ncbi:MAG TPA: alpha/beta hydrolase-fold protein [Gemmataceae bacterium]|jgi:S-formylglutathione hydrolase|nr:alpha/beta hydrolase-fold protein [Gemmataceae bacterium]
MQGTWISAEIAGKAADVYEPEGAGKPRFGVLHLHGGSLETLRDRPAFTRLFDERKLACVCPHGGRCWWVDRLCPEFDPKLTPERYLIDWVLPFFRQRWGLAPPAVGVQGISMGGQGALRLAFKHPHLFPVVAAIAPALDYYELYGDGTPLDDLYDSKEQCRQDTALMHVPPTGSPPHIFFCTDPDDARWYRGTDRLHEKLSALGIAHEQDMTTRAGGHSWDYFNHMAERAERFVYAGLEQESRRLL